MKKITLLGAVAFLLLGTTSYAQVTTAGNNSIPPPQFVGFNGIGPIKDLQIRNDFNRPITFHTNGVQRMIINEVL